MYGRGCVGVTAETAGDEVDNVGAVQLIERLPMVKDRCNRICVVHSDLIYINLNGPDGTVAWRADRPPVGAHRAHRFLS